MEPTVLRGGTFRIEPQAALRTGDVVLFESGDRTYLILHRVIWSLRPLPYFVHRGDARGGAGIARWDHVRGRAVLPSRAPGIDDHRAALRAVLGASLDALAATVFRLDGTLTVRMQLPLAAAYAPRKDIEVREVPRHGSQTVFAQSELAPGTLAELDAIAPLRWRCFAAFDDGHPIHHTFVAYRDTGPELFRVWTAASHRRRGVFVEVVSAIARSLSDEHESAICSKIGVRNPTSLQAHRAAGFVVVRRRYDPILFGWDMRRAASVLWRRARGRPLQ